MATLWGFIFCMPWKYPLITDENAMTAILGLTASRGYKVRASVIKCLAIKGARKIINKVKIMLVHDIMKKAKEIICFILRKSPFSFASAIRFDMAIGKPICVNVSIKNKEGRAII